MSVASSPFPNIRIKTPSSSSSTFRFTPPKPTMLTVRCTQSDGPRRPVAPTPPTTLKKPLPPSPSPPLVKPSPPPLVKPSPSPTSEAADVAPPVEPPKPAAAAAAAGEGKGVITVEFQRLKAKELQEYFKQKKIEEANQGPFFGFIPKNEIGNGRWAMFGFAVGMLTEYATGSDFVDQVKILLSNFGILDLE